MICPLTPSVTAFGGEAQRSGFAANQRLKIPHTRGIFRKKTCAEKVENFDCGNAKNSKKQPNPLKSQPFPAVENPVENVDNSLT